MIRSFKHKGLVRFFQTGSRAGIQAQHADRLALILGRLGAATAPKDMGLPGLGLHALKGDRKGTWAVTVSGNCGLLLRSRKKMPSKSTTRTITEVEDHENA